MDNFIKLVQLSSDARSLREDREAGLYKDNPEYFLKELGRLESKISEYEDEEFSRRADLDAEKEKEL